MEKLYGREEAMEKRQIILMCLVNQGRRVAEPTCIIKTRTRCHSGQCSRIAEEVSEVHHM